MQLQPRPAPPPPILRVVPASVEPRASRDLSPEIFAFVGAGIVLIGFIVRLGFVLSGDFPLHDGGLFFQMVRDLQRAHYALPSTTTYNSGGIPFAYPPLSMYVAGLLDDATPLGLINIFRFLPLIASTATIGAFLLIARAMLPTRASALAATFAFAMLPRGFLWLIMGGGLTRSFGMLFAMLTIHSAHQLYTRGERRYAVTATVFAALAVLSHIEMAWFAAFTTALLFVACGRDRRSIVYSAAIGAGVLALTSPWWVTVLAQHGPSPFVGASQTGEQLTNPLISFIGFRFTSEPLFPLLAGTALLGATACLAQRRFLLLFWILVCQALDPRAFGTVAAVPLALLVGAAVSDVLVPLARGVLASEHRAPTWLLPGVLAVAALYAALGAVLAGTPLLSAMSRDERDAMQWASQNTPPSSRFLIVSADRWNTDRTSEWFPLLAQRQSVATTQAYEWLPDGTFNARLDAYADVQKCSSKDGGCIDAWSAATGVAFDYLYLPKLAPRAVGGVSDDAFECCAALRAALRSDARYVVTFDGAGATIFRRNT